MAVATLGERLEFVLQQYQQYLWIGPKGYFATPGEGLSWRGRPLSCHVICEEWSNERVQGPWA
jgi:hypothetical protein